MDSGCMMLDWRSVLESVPGARDAAVTIGGRLVTVLVG